MPYVDDARLSNSFTYRSSSTSFPSSSSSPPPPPTSSQQITSNRPPPPSYLTNAPLTSAPSTSYTGTARNYPSSWNSTASTSSLPEEENVDDTAEQEQRLEQRANNLVPSLKKVLDKLTTTVSVSYKLSREQKKSYIDEIASIRALLKHKNLSQDPVGGVQRVEREWDEITQKLRNLGVQC